MLIARFVLALLVVAGAALAACSGNFGSATQAPNGLIPSGPLSGIAPTPTATPSSASNIMTYGDSTAFQPLPEIGGYGGAIAFETPSPRPSGFQAVPIGATLAIVPPADTPDLNALVRKGKRSKRERPARPLAYITLLATRDVSLQQYPRIAVDVPRDIVTTYREEEINLALFNSGDKDTSYRLAVAEHDVTASPPPAPPVAVRSAAVVAAASPTGSAPPLPPGASPTPTGPLTPPPGIPPAPGASGSPGVRASAVPTASPTLPPQRILFAGTAAPLKLVANKPVVFAVYALPIATPSPAPSGSGVPRGAGSPSPSASGSPSAAAAASPGTIGTPVPPVPPASPLAPTVSSSASPAAAGR